MSADYPAILTYSHEIVHQHIEKINMLAYYLTIDILVVKQHVDRVSQHIESLSGHVDLLSQHFKLVEKYVDLICQQLKKLFY